jgi:CPA2 family monovalent cation:H+ antiporter-2
MREVMIPGMPSMNLLAAAELPPLFVLLAIMLMGVVLVSLLLLRLQQSLLAGYFLCGIVIANSGVLDWLGGAPLHNGVAQMSDFGVMLLMFTLGLEFSLSELKYLRRLAFGGGGLQMGLCGLAGGALAVGFWGVGWQAALVLAVVLGMSSTAVSLKTYQDLHLSTSPGARFALAVAIFQDLFIIVFFLILPVLLPLEVDAQPLGTRLTGLLLRGGLFVVLAVVSARWIIPWLLGAVTRTRNRELFTLTVIGCCVGLAFLGGMLELGLALGAFVAGLAVSESIYKHRILADVLPLKDLFLTLFFVSVGLMVDLSVALDLWQPILAMTALLLLLKGMLISLIGRAMGLAPRQALIGGLGLASAGEFSLVLLQKTGPAGLWSVQAQQILLASVALSMGILPALMRLSDPIHDILARLGWGQHALPAKDDAILRKRTKSLAGHAIICGYGPVGQALNSALLNAGVPTLVIELNAETVKELQRDKQPVLFADASHEETWALARLATAKMVAFTFPAAPVTVHAMEMVRESRPDVPILARARFASDVERLKRLGVTEVINDEIEAGRAVVDRALILHGG